MSRRIADIDTISETSSELSDVEKYISRHHSDAVLAAVIYGSECDRSDFSDDPHAICREPDLDSSDDEESRIAVQIMVGNLAKKMIREIESDDISPHMIVANLRLMRRADAASMCQFLVQLAKLTGCDQKCADDLVMSAFGTRPEECNA